MANKSKLLANLSSSISAIIGEIRYVNDRANFGSWLILNAQSLSRTAYANLFATYIQTISGNITSGNATISGISSTSTLKVGMKVEGVGIPAGATIVTIVNGTSITISANATSTATAVSLRFFRNGVGRGDGSTTFSIPNLGQKVLIGGYQNSNVNGDFLLASGSGASSNSDPISNVGNWFICLGV